VGDDRRLLRLGRQLHVRWRQCRPDEHGKLTAVRLFPSLTLTPLPVPDSVGGPQVCRTSWQADPSRSFISALRKRRATAQPGSRPPGECGPRPQLPLPLVPVARQILDACLNSGNRKRARKRVLDAPRSR
jgi:hypothetical protein